ncbi:MAG: helix-turn-helix domain-containing protein [Chloroflexota bacterium]|nr:helix-turn-helix domain-containing protein [Chloroflexota bacterium]
MTTDAAPTGRIDPLAEVLDWDVGTAYELLLSLRAIFLPKDYGIPAPWAAGVRKRLSPNGQRDLKDFFNPPFSVIAYMPVHLVLEMDAPKTVERFLDYVEAIPGPEFMQRIYSSTKFSHIPSELRDRALAGKGMSDADVEEYRRGVARSAIGATPSVADVRRLFEDMENPEATKARWLMVMREYQAVFFAEEERRLQPILDRMLADAKVLAKKTTVPDLLERLSNGFTLSADIELDRLVLVPSVWLHPYVVRAEISERELLVVWGAHPPGHRVVPGESVPEDALLVLRALADPTRLRLLRLIAAEPRSLQSLAQEVKLSLPTVSHHIRELRGSGLIRLEVGGRGRESKYTVRWPSAERAFEDLKGFVLAGSET